MLVRQSKNTFIRCRDNNGYIISQLTFHDRSYNETGTDFLKEISRQPQDVDDIVDRLMMLYRGVKRDELKADFIDFITDLAEHLFLVIGETEEELDEKDIDFSYKLENPKTLVEDFSQDTKQRVKVTTQDFITDQQKRQPHLISLQFELTSRCNERCIHCYIPNEKKNHGFDMPKQKVFDILDEYAADGGIQVTLSGGEVLMHKDIIEILRYCRKKDLRISVLTNLIALKDEMVDVLKEVNISFLQVSLYSMDASIHDFITTVKGSYEKTKAAIEKLVANDIPVQISCPVMKANRKGYKDVLKYAQSLRIKAQTDYIMMAQSDLNTQNLANRISLEETEELLRDIIEYDIDYIEEMEEISPYSEFIRRSREEYLHMPVCGVGMDAACITANGDVYPCAGWQDMVLGNVYKQSLKEIWTNSEKVKELRQITNASFPKCVDCEARDYCAMCMVRNYNESGGDMFKINKHFCDVAHLNKRLVEEYMKKSCLTGE